MCRGLAVRKVARNVAYCETALGVNKLYNCQAITEHNLLWLTTCEEVAETLGKTVGLEVAETLVETLVAADVAVVPIEK